MNGTGRNKDISADAVPSSPLHPWEKRAAQAMQILKEAAERRGYKYHPPGPRRPGRPVTPLEYDLARPETDLHHSVYLMYAAGRVKIGYTSGDVYRRASVLNNQSPVEVVLVKTIPGGSVTEFRLHHQFKEARSHGEWFLLSSDLERFIADSPRAQMLERAEREYIQWLRAELKRMEAKYGDSCD